MLHQARVGLHELERPLDLASPEDDPCPGVAGPRAACEKRDERARSGAAADLSKEEAARTPSTRAWTERDEAADKSRAAWNDSQARTEQFDAGIPLIILWQVWCQRSGSADCLPSTVTDWHAAPPRRYN